MLLKQPFLKKALLGLSVGLLSLAMVPSSMAAPTQMAQDLAKNISSTSSDLKGEKKGPINVFYYSLNDLFINQLSKSLQEEADAKGIALATYDASDDLMRQLSQMQTALSIRRATAPILMNPVDSQNGQAALRTAKQNKSPIIFFNRKPSDNVFKSYKDAWYVGTNPNSAGYYQAEIVMDYFKAHPEMDRNGDGRISYIMLKGDLAHQDTRARSNTFVRSMIDSKVNLKAVDTIVANWSQPVAQLELQNRLNRINLDDVELIVSNNDAMALGALRAIQGEGYNLSLHAKGSNSAKDQVGLKFIPIVGIDAIPAALDEVKRGTMIGTVLNDYKTTAKVLINMSDALINHNDISTDSLGIEISAEDLKTHSIEIPYQKVTKDNVQDFNS